MQETYLYDLHSLHIDGYFEITSRIGLFVSSIESSFRIGFITNGAAAGGIATSDTSKGRKGAFGAPTYSLLQCVLWS